MSLHVAVNGISSHQRPAWNKHKKGKQREKMERNEAVDVAQERVLDEEERLTDELERGLGNEKDEEKLNRLKELRMDMEESLRLYSSSGTSDALDWDDVDNENGNGNGTTKRWEDLTSANSLADAAKLHCKIDLEEEKLAMRNRLMRITRRELLPHLFPSSSSSVMTSSSTLQTSAADKGCQENITEDLDSNEDTPETLMTETVDSPLTLLDLLTYCSTDVLITHGIFQIVLPSFLNKRCPHPVSLAGVLTMGSSFLPVNKNWEKYIENAERVYRGMEESVRRA